MELQWPLILFTSLIAWSAGVFAAHGVLIVRGKKLGCHLALLLTSLVLMVVGGIAVFMHLEHWERIFNGFGHLSSGITQELIGIVLMVVMMVVIFALLRRRGDGTLPKWTGVAAILLALLMIFAMGHSYMMAARPAWDSVFQMLSLLGAACVMGPATAAAVLAVRGEDASMLAGEVLVGSIVNAVCTVAYLASMNAAQASYTDIGYYYDPANLARGMIDFDSATGLMAGGREPMVVVAVLLALAAVAVACVLFLRARKDGAGASAEDGAVARAKGWIAGGCAIALCGFVTAIVLRMVFYELGHAVYIFF